MCLFVKKDSRLRRAKEDIIVYKILYYSSSREQYTTPYRGVPVGKTVIGKTLRARGIAFRKKFGALNYRMMKQGIIHSYTNLSVAQINLSCTETLFKAIIPKGTRYICGGEFGGSIEECGSKKIKFVEKIK